ncbi:phosphoribosylanthranilate isomerase [Verticiella sediminum]|uniref:N-(5'-phosphoribosyl)anthranilate isomerase n=1 Tax=Verticiella sediminum TaxID=1247510 RepID=A0A556AS53_9BURK|nr:phosphoribosylanthranilate isomerase [Verticiella sediminum]TSH95767.1 phosphoribosylanthranilate isomerase [Verticiella sediminum]
MSRTRIKFCGFTREADIDAAVAAGADAIGLVFYPASKRCLTLERAAELRRRVPAFVSVVALTVNEDEGRLREIAAAVRPDLLQFHGDESPEACLRQGLPYLRAFRVGAPGLDTPDALLESCLAHELAAGWLFDSHSTGYGGSGRSFDWSSLTAVARSENARPLVLSGGLHVARVRQALAEVRPYAVDVSSGVESEPGIKDAGKMRQFAEQVRRHDEDAARETT